MRRRRKLKVTTRTLADGIPPGEPVTMIAGHAPGAYELGTRIKKVKGEPGDSTPIGDEGTVLSSVRNEDVAPNVFYFVEWDHTPGLPVGIIDWKIGPVS